MGSAGGTSDVLEVGGWSYPWLGGVEVDTLDPLTAGEELSLRVHVNLWAHDGRRCGCIISRIG